MGSYSRRDRSRWTLKPIYWYSGGIKEQTQRVLQNLQGLLESEGLNLSHVMKTTVFMTDLAEFAAMNEVYARFFVDAYPARSTIQVAALPMGAKVEIEAIAHT